MLAGGATDTPTNFAELNDLLAELVARIQSVLGEALVGMYLTGSFALGAGDLYSDCDFLVVTDGRITESEEQALRALHDEIPTRDEHWAINLEGSYAPRDDLETLAALGREWLYVDRGRRELQWSDHCNTLDVRWVLRERGITLVGPAPHSFACEVPADALRHKLRPLVATFLPDLLAWTSLDGAWSQRYAVTALCRMLHTIETGDMTSKPGSLRWAKTALDPQWNGLIEQVLDDRAEPWNDPPRPGSVDATIAFTEYAKQRAVQQVIPVDARCGGR